MWIWTSFSTLWTTFSVLTSCFNLQSHSSSSSSSSSATLLPPALSPPTQQRIHCFSFHVSIVLYDLSDMFMLPSVAQPSDTQWNRLHVNYLRTCLTNRTMYANDPMTLDTSVGPASGTLVTLSCRYWTSCHEIREMKSNTSCYFGVTQETRGNITLLSNYWQHICVLTVVKTLWRIWEYCQSKAELNLLTNW